MLPGLPDAHHLTPTDVLIERAVLACIADGVIVNDVAGKVVLVNQAAGRLLHADPRTLMGMPIRQLFQSFSPVGRTTIEDALDRLYTDPYSYGPGEGITETIVEVGLLVIKANLSAVLTEVGEFVGIVTVLRDITREVEAERAKSEFVSNVSHELRTPLTSIVGYATFLLNHAVGPLNEQQDKFLRVIHTNGQRLVTLINDILDVSRIESGRLELDIQPVHLEKVVQDVVDMIKPQSDQKELELVLRISSDLHPVLGDANRLSQVVANLLSNACRYTPHGGQITVAVSYVDSSVRVDVTDTGIGISAEDQNKIFQRFYRVSSATAFESNGTGLGLPITKMLVEMHGGRLWVDSVVGLGSTFTFVLPAQAQPAEEVRPLLVEVPAGAGRVLVVEDDLEIARLIELHLHREGLATLSAHSGREALEQAQRESIDLITLDMILPDLSGMEVLRRLKADAHTRNIPVVIVSILRDESSDGTWGNADPASKPFALEKLIENVRHTLAAKRAPV